MVKLAVKKEPGAVPFSGYHYMLHPFKMSSDYEAAVFKQIGYIIVEVDEATANRLTAEACAALNHQVEVAFIVENAGSTQNECARTREGKDDESSQS